MNKKQKAIYIYFIILPFIDVITSIIVRFTSFSVSLGMIVKGITMILSVLYIFFISKSKYKKRTLKYILTIIAFGLLYFITKKDIWNVTMLKNEITYAFRYLYFSVMLSGLLNVFDDFEIDSKLIKKILLINCISYTILLLIPAFTNTGFNSYRYSSVFGKNGWFYAANETGVITIILLSSITYFLDIKNKWKLLFTLPILISIALIGTKVSYFGMIIIAVMVAIKNIIENKKKGIIVSVALLVLLGIACQFSPTIQNLKGSIEDSQDAELIQKREEESKKDGEKYKYSKMEDIIKNKNAARIVTIALNGRESFFLKNYSIYSESSTVDKLFGISWSNRKQINYTLEKKLIEIDYLDILIHYGIVGFLIYYYSIVSFIVSVIKQRKKIDSEILYYILIFALVVLISCMAGHILAAPSVSIYLVLIMLLITFLFEEKNNCNLIKKNNCKSKDKKKITIFALHLGFGGVEKYLSSLCKMLEDKYEIEIISTYKVLDKPAFPFSDNIKITYLIDDKPNKEELKQAIRNKNIINIFKEGLKSVKILCLKRSRNIKAIRNTYSDYIITTRYFHSRLVGYYAYNNIIKIATEHNFHNNDKKYITKVIDSIRSFDYFVVVSNNLKEFYENKIGKTKCIYIPNVIDNLPDKRSKLNNKNIITIGRLSPEKGQKDLIDVFKMVNKELPKTKLFMVGDGPLKKELENYTKELKLTDKIIFTGFLGNKEKEKYILDSSIFILPSYTESFGLVLIEAMSYGLPCIAFDSSDGAKELLKNNVGILVKDRDKEKMAEAIIKELKNKNGSEYSDKGYKYCQRYLIDNVKEEWYNILK